MGGLGRPGFCPAAMAAAMDEGLEEIKHESVDLVRIDPICVFSFVCVLLLFQSICRSGLQCCFWSASFEVLRSAFNCALCFDLINIASTWRYSSNSSAATKASPHRMPRHASPCLAPTNWKKRMLEHDRSVERS